MAVLIVIDGSAGVGKGTLAVRLADYFGFRFLDSGLMYRAVASKCLETDGDPLAIARSLSHEDLRRSDLRSEEVSRHTPSIASSPEVREALNVSLRKIIAQPPGSVLDGRAGAYEFPEAQVKIFLTASDEVRAQRRLLQLQQSGVEADFDQVLKDLRFRDQRDRERLTAPLMRAHGAFLIDSSNLDVAGVFAEAVAYCDKVLSSH